MSLANIAGSLVRFRLLAGPVFDKELRVASRRRRNYVLRTVYLLVFTFILGMIWTSFGRRSNSVYNMAAMSQVGIAIASFIVWFQFIATQFVAIVLLSTAISDEIYNRTLGVLMTTPISSFHIVTGKLASRMYQLLLLICLSLPVLATIRVFGGIPWQFLISSLAITLCAIIFVGSISLFYSIFFRRAYVIIILATLTVAFMFLLIPVMTVLTLGALDIAHTAANERIVMWLCTAGNPWGYLFMETGHLYSPRAASRMMAAPLYVHCLIMLSASAVFIAMAVALVRKVALRQIAGDTVAPSARKERKGSKAVADGRIATVVGSPIVWKELRTPLLRRRRLWMVIPAILGALLLGLTYLLVFIDNGLDNQDAQMAYMILLGLSGMLFAVAIPAGVISSEKESRSWLLLLTTTLSDWNILLGKALGSLRRVLPCFGLLALHMVFFTLIGFIHPICLIQLPIPIIGIVLFLTGTGLYFSSRLKHTTTAVIANFLFAATIWFLIPVIVIIFCEISRVPSSDFEWILDINPFVHCVVLMEKVAGESAANKHFLNLRYHFEGAGTVNVFEATVWTTVLSAMYVFCGLFFAWRAKCRFRRNIF